MSVIFHLVLARGGLAQAPANDNFADRTVLTGNNVTFIGNLSGSTSEANEPTNAAFCYCSIPVTRSVWWSWTAAESGPVTLVALSYAQDTYFAGLAGCGEITSALAVYAGTNLFVRPGPIPLAGFCLNAAVYKLAASFQATAGTEYEIQFFGVHPTQQVTFQLVATNPPVILDPPTDQTVFPGGSALFAVLATGLSPLSYQWRLDGTDLPGATNLMLALDYVTPDQAGAYSVAVSNSTGVIVAGPASLVINSNPISPLLGAGTRGGSNAFAFTVAGEAGRYYRIESSTNLLDWRPESSFPPRSPLLVYPTNTTQYRSVVYCTNSSVSFSIPNGASNKFVRACLYSAPDEVCNNHLKQIRLAMALWVRSGAGWSRNAEPDMEQLQPFCPDIAGFKCPAGGTFFYDSYCIGPVYLRPDLQEGEQPSVGRALNVLSLPYSRQALASRRGYAPDRPEPPGLGKPALARIVAPPQVIQPEMSIFLIFHPRGEPERESRPKPPAGLPQAPIRLQHGLLRA